MDREEAKRFAAHRTRMREYIAKAKSLPPGTRRTWGGTEYVKRAQGDWVKAPKRGARTEARGVEKDYAPGYVKEKQAQFDREDAAYDAARKKVKGEESTGLPAVGGSFVDAEGELHEVVGVEPDSRGFGGHVNVRAGSKSYWVDHVSFREEFRPAGEGPVSRAPGNRPAAQAEKPKGESVGGGKVVAGGGTIQHEGKTYIKTPAGGWAEMRSRKQGLLGDVSKDIETKLNKINEARGEKPKGEGTGKMTAKERRALYGPDSPAAKEIAYLQGQRFAQSLGPRYGRVDTDRQRNQKLAEIRRGEEDYSREAADKTAKKFSESPEGKRYAKEESAAAKGEIVGYAADVAFGVDSPKAFLAASDEENGAEFKRAMKDSSGEDFDDEFSLAVVREARKVLEGLEKKQKSRAGWLSRIVDGMRLRRAVEEIRKGRKGFSYGTERTWGGKKYRKEVGGWKEVGAFPEKDTPAPKEAKGTPADAEIGAMKKEPSADYTKRRAAWGQYEESVGIREKAKGGELSAALAGAIGKREKKFEGSFSAYQKLREGMGETPREGGEIAESDLLRETLANAKAESKRDHSTKFVFEQSDGGMAISDQPPKAGGYYRVMGHKGSEPMFILGRSEKR